MVEYNEVKRGFFSKADFETEMDKAMESISKKLNLKSENFHLKRHSPNQSYSVSGENFMGDYLSYQVTRESEILFFLDCFCNNENTYIEIFTLTK